MQDNPFDLEAEFERLQKAQESGELFSDEPPGFSDMPSFSAPLSSPSAAVMLETRAPQFAPLEPMATSEHARNIDLLLDVSLRIAVELGRATMAIRDILALTQGSVVELDKVAGEPVDILVNETLIARGEVVVVDEKFGVRVTEIVSADKRVASLGPTR